MTIVADCRSTRHNSNISFHRIPKTPESRRKLWIKATGRVLHGRNKFAPTNNSLLFGRHFVNGKRSDDPTSVDFIPTLNLPVTLPVTLRQRRATVSSMKSSKYDGAVETLVKENCSVCYTKKRVLLPEIDLRNVQNEVQISNERSDEMTECEMLHCQIPCEWRKRQKKKEVVKAEKGEKGPTVKPPLVNLENAEEHMTAFTNFYKSLNLVAEEEWDEFFRCMFTPVPFSFRLAENRRRCNNIFEGKPGCVGQAEVLRDFFKEHVLPTTADVRFEDGSTFQCNPVPLFPKDLVWQCNVDHKAILGKGKRLKKFRTFTFEEERCNALYKQDVSRFVGPLLVDIHPDDKILELCCAPGNQTVQIAEMMHANPDRPAEGFILCNDIETDLISYRWTIGPNTLFVHEKAEKFPKFYSTWEKDPESRLEYDLIFLDPPSTNDGLMRKDIYRRGAWDINNALKEHTPLRNKLDRAVKLLAVNGKVLYCTSSMNPIENEAVVAAVLREAKGSLELVDVSHRVTNFKTRPGLDTWKILSAGNVSYKDYESCPSWFKKDHEESVFPPNEDEIKEFQLSKCMRILPHDNNTHAAFYALIKKTAPLPEKEEVLLAEAKEEPADADEAEAEEPVDEQDPEEMEADEGDEHEDDNVEDEGEEVKQGEKKDVDNNEPELTAEERKRLKKVEKKRKDLEKKRKNLQLDVMMACTEIDWVTEITDTDLTTSTEKQTLKYRQPKVKVARKYLKAFYGANYKHKCSRFKDVDPDSPAMKVLKEVYGVTIEEPELHLMALEHDQRGVHYYYTSPVVKKIVKNCQKFFQQAPGHAAGFHIMKLEDEDINEMAISPMLPMILKVTKRMVHVTRGDLVAMLSDKTIHISALSEGVQHQLSELDDRGPLFFIYEPKGPNPNPKCPILLKRNKYKMFIQDCNYNMIENKHHLRLCGVTDGQENEDQEDEPNVQVKQDPDGDYEDEGMDDVEEEDEETEAKPQTKKEFTEEELLTGITFTPYN